MEKQVVAGHKKVFFYAVLVLLPWLGLAAAYLGYSAYRTVEVYYHVKSGQHGWRGALHRPDPALGIATVPGAQGGEICPLGPDVPTRHDARGFRIPVDGAGADGRRPLVLSLGCSFTYGAAVRAEDAYPYLVGAGLGGSSFNAGVCTHGLAQMLILAERLIPEHKPDYVIAQYSPWLLQRAQTPFAPSYIGKLPSPYFYKSGQGYALQPPVFLGRAMELPLEGYRNAASGWMEALSFFWHVGLPLYVYDDFNMVRYYLRKAVGAVPAPSDSPDGLTAYAYGEIGRLARQNGAKLVVVVLGLDEAPVRVDEALFPPEALVVDAHRELLGRLPAADHAHYLREYAHWRGSPPRMMDNHPNQAAHKIIAEAVVAALRAGGGR